VGGGPGDEGKGLSEERRPGGVVTGEVEREGEPGAPAGQRPDERWKVWAAILGALVIPTLLWAAVPVVALLPLAGEHKVWVSGGLVVAAEAVFWVSALLLGREAVRRYRRYLDPRTWSRKR
jgi:hypothetical protein